MKERFKVNDNTFRLMMKKQQAQTEGRVIFLVIVLAILLISIIVPTYVIYMDKNSNSPKSESIHSKYSNFRYIYTYRSALDLFNSQQYEEAYDIFQSLNYKDSSIKAEECIFMKQKCRLTDVVEGSTIKFGYYEQDNDTSNGKEEIEWIVLDVKDKKAQLISKYALDCQRYNSTDMDTDWETSSLRTWINDSFYYSAFGDYHQKMILNSTVTAEGNPYVSAGRDTTDKVYILSFSEAMFYFESDSERLCKGTEYCNAQGAVQHRGKGGCHWWLRAPGFTGSLAAYVDEYGACDVLGCKVDFGNVAIRPVMWIDLAS